MRNVIICEGSTDLVLIQYFMEKANGWSLKDERDNERILEHSGHFEFQFFHNFTKDDNELTIGETGGCSRITKSFASVLEMTKHTSSKEDIFDNIVIICDRDEKNAIEEFDSSFSGCFSEFGIFCTNSIENDTWLNCSTKNSRGDMVDFRVLLLIIPFEETGALETFLLNAISDDDSYDRHIISESNAFVDTVDTDERYLSKRRYKTKAKFDVYFSIRTPLEQFRQRREILRGIPWEEYENVQKSFRKLKELG